MRLVTESFFLRFQKLKLCEDKECLDIFFLRGSRYNFLSLVASAIEAIKAIEAILAIGTIGAIGAIGPILQDPGDEG